MNAREVINRALLELGIDDADMVETPTVLDALDAAGFAVVELPAHSVNGEDDAQWLTESHTIIQGFSGEVVIDDRLGIDGCELAAVGAAIMAAAARYVPAVAAEQSRERVFPARDEQAIAALKTDPEAYFAQRAAEKAGQ